MRILWIFIVLIVLAGILAFALGGEDPSQEQGFDPSATALQTADPVPAPEKTPEQAPEEEPKLTLAQQLANAAAARTETAQAEATAPETPTEPAEELASTDEPPAASITDGLDADIPHAEVIPGKIERISANELEVDDEWTLKGEGTQESPYEPSWEYLFSAADTYQPRLEEHEIPQRIALLNDKWVRVAGFTAFPLVTGETSEMLVMLNKWDGCCIGVPPTPFDAVEVRLTTPVARGPKHQITFGSVTGRMKVDPYLIENWLVGLYILEESTLTNDL